jgi:hypothetical protein
VAERVCQAVVQDGRRYRAINPWSAADAALLAAVSRGEYAINEKPMDRGQF